MERAKYTKGEKGKMTNIIEELTDSISKEPHGWGRGLIHFHKEEHIQFAFEKILVNKTDKLD